MGFSLRDVQELNKFGALKNKFVQYVVIMRNAKHAAFCGAIHKRSDRYIWSQNGSYLDGVAQRKLMKIRTENTHPWKHEAKRATAYRFKHSQLWPNVGRPSFTGKRRADLKQLSCTFRIGMEVRLEWSSETTCTCIDC